MSDSESQEHIASDEGPESDGNSSSLFFDEESDYSASETTPHRQALEDAMRIFIDAPDRNEDEDEDGDEDEDHEGREDRDPDAVPRRKAHLTSLKKIVNVVRRACEDDAVSSDERDKLAQKASDYEQNILHWVYKEKEMDHVQPYCGKLVNDTSNGAGIGLNFPAMIAFFNMFSEHGLLGPGRTLDGLKSRMTRRGGLPLPYDQSAVPNTHSTPLARFPPLRKIARRETSDPIIQTLIEARCEILSEGIPNPIRMVAKGDILALLGCGGYKEREPCLTVWNALENFENSDSESVDQGHFEIPHEAAIDSARRLLWTADRRRIKSTRCTFPAEEGASPTHLSVHTFDSANFEGPIEVFNAGGHLMRAGKSKIAIWNVDDAPNHGPKGKKIIGGRVDHEAIVETLSRDMDCEFEESKGSSHNQTTSLDSATSKAGISRWSHHPSDANLMICTGSDNEPRLFTLDIERGAMVSNFVGVGDRMSDISVHPSAPELFATSSGDGVAKIWDTRMRTPVFGADHQGDNVQAVALAVVEGLPFLFSGGSRTECIRLWDIRAKVPVYALSTGNTQVEGLHWSDANQKLFAATTSIRTDRNGYTHDYRAARIRVADVESNSSTPFRLRTLPITHIEDHDPVHPAPLDPPDGEEWDDNYAWPEKSQFDEFAFGVAFDAGDHRLFEYTFKETPNPDILPHYGDARAGDPYDDGW